MADTYVDSWHGWDVKGNIPIDKRSIATNYSDLASIPFPHPGLPVWVLSEEKRYKVKNDLITWEADFGISAGDISDALGYTPYDASNPAGYISSEAAAAAYIPLSGTIEDLPLSGNIQISPTHGFFMDNGTNQINHLTFENDHISISTTNTNVFAGLRYDIGTDWLNNIDDLFTDGSIVPKLYIDGRYLANNGGIINGVYETDNQVVFERIQLDGSRSGINVGDGGAGTASFYFSVNEAYDLISCISLDTAGLSIDVISTILGFKGIQYHDDYSLNFTDDSLPNRLYNDGRYQSIASDVAITSLWVKKAALVDGIGTESRPFKELQSALDYITDNSLTGYEIIILAGYYEITSELNTGNAIKGDGGATVNYVGSADQMWTSSVTEHQPITGYIDFKYNGTSETPIGCFNIDVIYGAATFLECNSIFCRDSIPALYLAGNFNINNIKGGIYNENQNNCIVFDGGNGYGRNWLIGNPQNGAGSPKIVVKGLMWYCDIRLVFINQGIGTIGIKVLDTGFMDNNNLSDWIYGGTFLDFDIVSGGVNVGNNVFNDIRPYYQSSAGDYSKMVNNANIADVNPMNNAFIGCMEHQISDMGNIVVKGIPPVNIAN